MTNKRISPQDYINSLTDSQKEKILTLRTIIQSVL